VNGHAH